MIEEALAELQEGDRIRVTFETTVEIGEGPMIRPGGEGTTGVHLHRIPELAYEVIPPKIKPLDIIEARWLDSLPFGSIVLCVDNDTEYPWMKVKKSMTSDAVWIRLWCVDTFIKPYPSSHYRVLRVGWGFKT